MTSDSRKQFNIFAIVNLIPFEILLIGWGLFSIYLEISSGHFSIFTLLFSPIFLIIPIGLLLIPTYVCYLLFCLSKNWIIKALILYGFWVTIIFLALETFFVGLGGASMAVVDGGVTRRSLFDQAGTMTLKMLGFAHIFILPWLFIAFLLMKRFVPDILSIKERS